MSSTPSSAFVAMISGRLSPDGRMEISNAGHLAPLLRRGREIQAIKSHGMPLGMFTRGEFSTVSLDLNPGDLLFLFTDGLTDSKNGSEERYETSRLTRILDGGRRSGPSQAIRECLDDLAEFRGTVPPPDDLTLMAIQRQ
jgi:sigma-B regulation protein RsbU (phosphoserine phosphatase)